MQNIDEYEYGQQDFSLPHDVVQLPSQGVFYKSKKKSVKVGYLTAADENIISNVDSKKSVKESIILPLLRNRVYEKDLRPEELLDCDIEAIMIFLRNTSFGPEYNVHLEDPMTGKKDADQTSKNPLFLRFVNSFWSDVQPPWKINI